MDVLQIVTKVNNILNNFLVPFDCEALYDNDFAYYPALNKITYSFIVSDKHSKTFLEYTEKTYSDIKAPIFLWSFLHELGHHETEDDYEEEDWLKYEEETSKEMDDFEYYNLTMEADATLWAANYMRNHTEEVFKLWNQLLPLFKELNEED